MRNSRIQFIKAIRTLCKIAVAIGLPYCATAQIFQQGEKITNNNFTGTAYLKMLVEADPDNPTAVGNVSFEPGARTKWHVHPGGQILLALEGEGFYQEKGQPKKVLRKGDVVKCPPNVPHWHGASATKPFVQVAITNNQSGATVWLDKVTEEEYQGNKPQ